MAGGVVSVVVARVCPSGSPSQCAWSIIQVATAGGAGMGGEPAAAVDAQGVDADPVAVWVGMNLQLDSLPGPDEPGRNRVAAGLEGDQAVLPDPPQMLLGDQIGLVRQAPERGPISLSPDGDDLAVGAMHLGSADRQPGVERPVELARSSRSSGRRSHGSGRC